MIIWVLGDWGGVNRILSTTYPEGVHAAPGLGCRCQKQMKFKRSKVLTNLNSRAKQQR
jgi:hypothetical protein